ncbi:hypothetical protein GDO86_020482, partial [Hymenochirus boettgeri]
KCRTCYTCSEQQSNENCLNQTVCGDNETFCMTSVFSYGMYILEIFGINKECASSCSPLDIHSPVTSISVSCCSTDLCNVSNAPGVKSSPTVLTLSLGLLL